MFRRMILLFSMCTLLLSTGAAAELFLMKTHVRDIVVNRNLDSDVVTDNGKYRLSSETHHILYDCLTVFLSKAMESSEEVVLICRTADSPDEIEGYIEGVLAQEIGAVLNPDAYNVLVQQLPSTGKFEVAGIEDTLAIRFFRELQAAVKKNDSAVIANLIDYPIRVTIQGKKRLLAKPADFTRMYASVMTAKVKRAVLTQKEKDLFVNYQGVMIGNGDIWFALRENKLKIVAINN